MAGDNLHVLSVPSLSTRALSIRAGLLLDVGQGVDVVGARNAFGLVRTLVKRGMERLMIPGFDPEVFRYLDQIPEGVVGMPSTPLSSLHAMGVSSSIDVVTLQPLQEETHLPHMEQDVFSFNPGTLDYRSQQGWSVRGRQDVDTFYGWIFLRKSDLGFN